MRGLHRMGKKKAKDCCEKFLKKKKRACKSCPLSAKKIRRRIRRSA